jgi:hypothetical protein
VPEKPELIEFTASKRGPSLKDLKAKVVQSATPKPEPSSVNVKTNFHEPPKLKPKVNKKLLAGLQLRKQCAPWAALYFAIAAMGRYLPITMGQNPIMRRGDFGEFCGCNRPSFLVYRAKN